jgi:hypothetical protein
MVSEQGLKLCSAAIMRHTILWLIFAFWFPSYLVNAQSPSVPQGATSSRSDQQYFPVGVFDKNPQMSAYKERFYARFLAAMEEPSLLEASRTDDTHSYRLLLVSSRGRALAVRVTLHADGTGMLSGRLVASHPYEPDSTEVKNFVAVSKEEVQRLMMLLQGADFWSMPTQEAQAKYGYNMDGAHWVLEGARNHSYHAVDRWSPQQTAYSQVCAYLMELSPVKLSGTAQQKDSGD